MKLNAAMRDHQLEIIEREYQVSDILELSESKYMSLYHDLFKERAYFSERADMDGLILVIGKNQNDGILVDTHGTSFAYSSAFIPHARTIAQSHIRQIADYCISEGTEHSEDGRWQISYNELYDRFGTKISDINGSGKLLREELQQRDEINELIMTEDCIEISCHLEYCAHCQQGSVDYDGSALPDGEQSL